MAELRFLATLLKRSAQGFMADRCTQMAAAISYYVLFSLFPLLIFVLGVLGLFLDDEGLQQDVIDTVLEIVPLSEDQGRNDVTEAVQGVAGAASGTLGGLGLLGMAWAGSSMFGVIRRSLNVAWRVERERPFAQQKLLDLAMVAGLGMFFLASVAATAALRAIREFSEDLAYAGEVAENAGFLWDAGSFLIPLALSFAAFLALYWIAPAAGNRPRGIWPGALVAAVLFEVAKFGFAIYLHYFNNYDVVFGSLGGVAIFLLWVFVSASIMLFGAELASEYPRVLRGEYQQPPAPAKPLRERLVRAVRGLFVAERDEAPR